MNIHAPREYFTRRVYPPERGATADDAVRALEDTMLRLAELAYFEQDPQEALHEAALLLNRLPGAAGSLSHAREGLLRVFEKHFHRS